MAKDCIASIKNHSRDYELIIVDNHSTVRDSFWEENADTYIRFSQNRGIAPAWNAGIKASNGKYIAVCNDDILVVPDWLEKMREACDQPQAAVGSIPIQNLPQGEGIKSIYKWFPGMCFMIKPSTIERVGYFDEQFVPCNYEDVDYWTRVLKAGLKLYLNYQCATVSHKEGQTLHAEDLSKRAEANHQRFIDKWGFNPIPYFYQDQPISEVLLKI